MNIKLRHIMFYLFIVSVVAMGISFSRFSTTLTNFGAENNGIEFSTWVLEHEAETISLEDMLPGSSKTIAVSVMNWKDAGTEGEGEIKISGYSQGFNLGLETTGNLPLEFTLNESSGGKEVGFQRHGSCSYLSESLSFTAAVMETKNFTLTVTWPAGIKDEFYKHEIDYLKLSIKAEQS